MQRQAFPLQAGKNSQTLLSTSSDPYSRHVAWVVLSVALLCPMDQPSFVPVGKAGPLASTSGFHLNANSHLNAKF